MTVPSQPLLPTDVPPVPLPTGPTTGPATGLAAPPTAAPPRGFALLALLACIGAGAAQMSAALLTLTLKADQQVVHN